MRDRADMESRLRSQSSKQQQQLGCEAGGREASWEAEPQRHVGEGEDVRHGGGHSKREGGGGGERTWPLRTETQCS